MWYALVLGCAFAQGSAKPGPFDRLQYDHWAYDAVQGLCDTGLVFDAGVMRCVPDRTLTRYEFALALARTVHWGAFSQAQAPKPADQPKAAALWGKLLREFWPELLMIEEQAKPSLRERLTALPAGHWFHEQAQALLAAVPADAAPPSTPAMMPRPTPAAAGEPLPHDHWVYDVFTKLGDSCWPVPPAYCRHERLLTRPEAALGLHRLLSAILSIETPISSGHTPSPEASREAARPFRRLMAELQPEFDGLEGRLRDLGEPTVAARLEAIPRGHRFYPMAQALLGKGEP